MTDTTKIPAGNFSLADGSRPNSTFRTQRRTRRMARESERAAAPTNTALPSPAAPRRLSKIDQVVTLLRRDEGATLEELAGATGWLPHTTRAALTGLRKKGHRIDKTKRGDVTCYHIAVLA